MTRILLQPHLLPRMGGARVALYSPWRWWRLRLRPSPDGHLVHQSYDDPTNVTEVSFMFDLLENVEIDNPPAMHLRHYMPEYDCIGDLYGLHGNRRVVTHGPEGEVDVVWYQRPGPMWQQLPGNTCAPGDYQVSTGDRRELSNDDATLCIYMQDMPTLCWDLAAAHFTSEFEAALGEHRRGVAAAFGLPVALVGGDLMSPNEVRWREGLTTLGGNAITPTRTSISSSVLPESDLIDEIDRLVNDSIRPGPVDDYTADRYDKCRECWHDWHGLECEASRCDCINTDWLSN